MHQFAWLVHEPTSFSPAAKNVQPNCIDHVASSQVRCTILRLGDRRKLGRALHARTRPGPPQAEHAKRKSPCPHALHQSQTGTAARGRGEARRRFGDSSRLTWPAICLLIGALRQRSCTTASTGGTQVRTRPKRKKHRVNRCNAGAIHTRRSVMGRVRFESGGDLARASGSA
jgi:hypothetical protein